jgi:site-specific DNA-methyltransferase (adenine-specific)
MNINQIYNEDCQEGIKRIPDASIDCILTDPPYLYLKGQKLERPFDERALFTELKRVLKPTGFVILFGRGTSFYRWNTILCDLGFDFKEEIIWDKSYTSSPLMALSRIHETIAIHSLGKGVINKVKIPYLEMKKHELGSVIQDIKRMRSILNNSAALNNVLAYLEDNKRYLGKDVVDKYNVSRQPGVKQIDRSAAVLNSIENGMNEKSIIRSDRYDNDKFCKTGIIAANQPKTGDRCCNAVNSIMQGMNEKSIIRESGNRYKAIHPTQKPVRLLERLLALTTNSDDVVFDPFSGSCSTAVACINTNRKYIGFEIDPEYYEAGIKRLNEVLSEPKLAM